MTAAPAQLPHGMSVSVVFSTEFKRSPVPWLRAAREGAHVVIVNGRSGHVRPIAFLTPECPLELAALLPGLLAEVSEGQHQAASERAAGNTARVTAMNAARNRRATASAST